MKISKIFSALALVGVLALFSSCGETCYTCVDADGVSETLCEDDAGGSSELLELAVGLARAAGETCTED